MVFLPGLRYQKVLRQRMARRRTFPVTMQDSSAVPHSKFPQGDGWH
ncbi:hypothetical protein FAEPRAA2165_00157 [Faecalibacterium duncaniae]|uniref:Uncharacterized protein n=1 Tax=Faecalibacterium duncaniae (strain DSM 17677 / JCM 31915 / A2-165) TaxID=411483 RepID=C7H1L8_FAED2|nr:hypothetical protein FAEPRAA2165_00157 [Faecalibacterium duncaniae]